MTKAIVLLSGGLDSALALALALESDLDCRALAVNYGQRHQVELSSAEKLAEYYGVPFQTLNIDPASLASNSLTRMDKEIPQGRSVDDLGKTGIPSTEVPGRNLLFLTYAAIQARKQNATEIHVGFNAPDSLQYPDCSPAFARAFQQILLSCMGEPPLLLRTPLIQMDKREIVEKARTLRLPFHLTHTCYSPDENGRPCWTCDACALRKDGFARAGVDDPIAETKTPA